MAIHLLSPTYTTNSVWMYVTSVGKDHHDLRYISSSMSENIYLLLFAVLGFPSFLLQM